MEKKLTTKVQKINPKLPESSNNIANSFTVEPDDELTLEKKGTIYVTFDISGKKPLDHLLVTKVVNDVLHDAYFQSESASPIQSIEKAILKLRDNVVTLAVEETDIDPMVSFNISTAILWGNTIYVVQYGSANAFLMRDGQIKPVSAAKEGKFSVASGVVKDNDVVILSTDAFSKAYPPEKILGAGFQIGELDHLQAAIMLKFNVVQAFSKAEVVEFGAQQTEQKKAEEKENPKKQEQTETIQPKPKKKSKPKLRPKLKLPEINMQKILLPLVVLFVLAGIVALGASFYKAEEKIEEIKNEEALTEKQVDMEPEETEEEVAAEIIDPEQDRINRVQRVDPTFFYDIALTDENSNPTSIAIVGNVIFAADAGSGYLYLSDIETPKFVRSNSEYASMDNLINYNGNLAFTDTSGFKVLTTTTNALVETYSQEGLGQVDTYLEFVYSLNGNTVTKYEKVDTALEGTTWTTDETLIGATDIGVDVSIYVLKADGELAKYTAGNKDDFTLEGMDEPLNNPVKILTDTDLENMYIVDRGNKRIVILSKEGVLTKQLRLNQPGVWNDLKDVAVNEDETKVYVLDGSKIFEITLD